MAKVAAIICAAGASSRMAEKKKKQFTDMGGRAAFLRSIELFSERADIEQILLAIPGDDEELVKVKWGANLSFFKTKIYIGEKERFETVKKGLSLLKDDIELVAVHDAVRCCVTKEWIEKVIAKAAETGAAILACPVVDTLKQVNERKIVKTIDRSNLWEAQTPQVFKTELIKKAYGNLQNLEKTAISDDSQLIEALGHEVSIVEADASNIKITHKADIKIAEAILKSRPKPKPEGPIGPYIEAQW